MDGYNPHAYDFNFEAQVSPAVAVAVPTNSANSSQLHGTTLAQVSLPTQKPEFGITVTTVKNGRSQIIEYEIAQKSPVPLMHMPKRTIVLVVDISSSMNERCGLNPKHAAHYGQEAIDASSRNSRLDLVVNGANAIIKSLPDGWKVKIVVYSDVACTSMSTTQLTSDNRDSLIAQVNDMHASGCTNIEAGLREALTDVDPISSVFLLTDGVINRGRNDVGAVYKELRADCMRFPSVTCIMFGNEIDVNCMYNLAIEGGGLVHIPSPDMVGAIMINLITNTVATCGMLSVQLPPGARVYGYPCKTYTRDANSMDLEAAMYAEPTISYGNCLVQLGPIAASRKIYVECCDSIEEPQFMIDGEPIYITVSMPNHAHTILQGFLYAEFLDILCNIVERWNSGWFNPKYPVECLTKFQEKIANRGPAFNALMKQIGNELIPGIRNNIDSWGLPYLLMTYFAHRNAQCVSGREESQKLFMNERQLEFAERVLTLYNEIPMREPHHNTSQRGTRVQAMANTRSINVGATRGSAPCYAHGSLVLKTHTGGSREWVRVETLQRGDLVNTGNGSARIQCIVKTVVRTSIDLCVVTPLETDFVEPLLITRWHPIHVDGRWVYPDAIANEVQHVGPTRCQAVYSIVLEEGAGSVVVNGVTTVSLGHGLQTTEVDEADVGHSFWSRDVRETLQAMPGWDEGRIVLSQGCEERNAAGIVTSLIYNCNVVDETVVAGLA